MEDDDKTEKIRQKKRKTIMKIQKGDKVEKVKEDEGGKREENDTGDMMKNIRE